MNVLELVRNTLLCMSLSGFGWMFASIAFGNNLFANFYGFMLGLFIYFYIVTKEVKE